MILKLGSERCRWLVENVIMTLRRTQAYGDRFLQKGFLMWQANEVLSRYMYVVDIHADISKIQVPSSYSLELAKPSQMTVTRNCTPTKTSCQY